MIQNRMQASNAKIDIGFIGFRNIKRILEQAGNDLANTMIHHPKRVLYTGITGLIFTLCCTFLLRPSNLYAQPSLENHKYYTSIEIESGDTLWSIAEQFRTAEYISVQDYIKEVKEINGLSGDSITSGCYLIIPYYADEPLENKTMVD